MRQVLNSFFPLSGSPSANAALQVNASEAAARRARVRIFISTSLMLRRGYNTVRPHSALGWKPPAPEAIVPMDQRPIMH
jgi:transposase InsO family protein